MSCQYLLPVKSLGGFFIMTILSHPPNHPERINLPFYCEIQVPVVYCVKNTGSVGAPPSRFQRYYHARGLPDPHMMAVIYC